jgi:methionyl-tRNA formyltransferase
LSNKIKIIFLGTPDFAVASLKALVEQGMNIVAVVTAPDKLAGRGMKLQQSAVKKYALEMNIPVLQPEKLKNPDFLTQLKSYQADLQVVVAFRMLPELVWNMPPLGTINVHASLLPNYRGAAPINWAIMNGENTTGVTTFKLQHEIDTGNILKQVFVTISENETAGTLHDKLMIEGAQLLISTINDLQEGKLIEKPQVVLKEYKHAPKIFTETCFINWNQDADVVYNHIRGLSPYPAAFTIVNDKKMKIFSCDKIVSAHSHLPGHIQTDNKSFIHFACKDGWINIKELQLEGKTKMNTADFLRGNKI